MKNDIASGLHRVCRVLFAVVIVVAVVGSSITTADLARAGRFQVRCTASHVARVDPIVSPREMSAHEHEFFGNRTTRATSTVRSMLRGRTTCTTRGDTAAYWSPTVYIGSDRIAARSLLIYYRGDARTVPFPLGLKVITDRFEYGTDPENLRFFFPDCWDGRRLDSRNHRSHMAFSRRERCPATHPLHVPEIVEVFRYPVSVAASTGAVYSSGPIATTAHADFWNTWKRKRLARLVRFCLNRSLDCGRVDNRRVP